MMYLRNSTTLWRVSLLRVLGGLCTSTVYLFANRYDEYLAELKHQEELAREALNPTGVFICEFDLTNPLWWLNATVWNIILYLLLGLLLHRLLLRRIGSVFLLWQVIGASVIAAWGVTVLLGVILDGYTNKGAFPVEQILEGFIYTRYQIQGFKFIAVMAASNVIYGTVLQVGSRLYSTDRCEE
jgi:hypothetical protein